MNLRSKRLLLITLFLFSMLLFSNAQTWDWSKHLSSNSHVRPVSLAYSEQEDAVCVISEFSTSITVEGITFDPVGGIDILVVKILNDGTIDWSSQIGGIEDDVPKNVAINNNGNYIVSGSFSSTIAVDGTSITSTGSEDAFLINYAPNGNVNWLRNIGSGPGVDRANQLTFNAQNHIFLTGFFDDTINFGGSQLISNGYTNNFVLELDSSGLYINAWHFPGTNSDTRLNSISMSNDGGKLVSGYFFDTLSYPNNEYSVSQGNEDYVVFKINVSNSIEWIRQVGGPGSDIGWDAKSDEYGSIYVLGEIENTAQVDSSGHALFDGSPVTSNGLSDIFYAKYNKQGSLIWKKTFGGSGDDIGRSMQVKNSLVHFTGHISDTVIVDLDTIATTGVTDNDICFGSYNYNGNFIDLYSVRGNRVDRGLAIAYDYSGAYYISAFFRSDTLFIGSEEYLNPVTNRRQGLVAKFNNQLSSTFTTVNEIQCSGDNSGRLIVTPYYGTPPYTYNWSSNVVSSLDSLAYNLAAGIYSVTLTDDQANTSVSVITLQNPPSLSINSVITNVSCSPADGTSNDGIIDITVSGGTAANTYGYTWQAISGSGVNPTNEDQNTLTKGQYRVTVTDDNSCAESDQFEILEPLPLNFSGSIITNATGGGNDGAINLNPSGGNGSPYSFLWSSGASTEDLTGLFAGNYSVTMSDNQSCETDTTLLVQDLSAFLAFISNKVDVDCQGENSGSATVGTLGGSGSYAYSWTTSGGSSVGGNFATLSNVSAGSYIITVNDLIDLRSAQASVEISGPDQPLTAIIFPTHLTCYNNSSGIANLSVSGGTLPYSYNWSNGSTSEDVIELDATTYSVTITDANSCQEIVATELTEPPAMDINVNIEEEILCNGDATGALIALATGGTGVKSYQWNDPGNQTSNIATSLGAGLYAVTATDQNGCTLVGSRQLTAPPILQLSETHQDISCFGEADGIINLNPVGGEPQYSYSWSSGQISEDISDIGAGNYLVTVTDRNGCSKLLEVTITEPPQVQILSIDSSNITCLGDADGSIAIYGAGGTGTLTYSIDNGATFSTDSSFADLAASTYQVVVADANDCQSAIEQVELTAPEATNILTEESSDVSCNGDADGSITVSAQNSLGGLEYSIDGGTNYLANSGLFENLTPGSYQIFIRDANGCVVQSSELTVTEPVVLSLDTTITHATQETGGSIQGIASGGTSPFNYYVQGDTTLSNTEGSFVQISEGNYTIYVVDDNSCTSDTLEVLVKLSDTGGGPEDAVTIYDAFSPNEDNINDVWNIGNIENFPNCSVIILNSWGNKVFTSNGYTEAWDGTYNGNNLPAGTYYYIIDLGEGSEVISGPVSLIR